MMQQALFSIIRPKLNLAADFNQAAHLIEHLLLSPERLRAIGVTDNLFAKSLLLANGYTSELYCAEYYIANQEQLPLVRELLLKNSNSIPISEETFQREKAALTQELREKRGPIISQAEQFERAVYQANEPAVRNQWFSEADIKDLTLEEAQHLLQSYGQPQIIQELTFTTTEITPHEALPTNHILPGMTKVTLTHPDQSIDVSDVHMLIPLRISDTTYPQLMAYIATLGNYRFGSLIQRLRHQLGLIYDINVYYHTYAQSVALYFRCANAQVDRCIEEIRSIIANPELYQATSRYAIDHSSRTDEAAWGNISQYPLFYLEEALLIGLTTTPKERFAAIRQSSNDDVTRFGHDLYLHSLTNSLTCIQTHGTTPTTTVDKL